MFLTRYMSDYLRAPMLKKCLKYVGL